MIKWGIYWLAVAALVPVLLYARPFDGSDQVRLVAGPRVAVNDIGATSAVADQGAPNVSVQERIEVAATTPSPPALSAAQTDLPTAESDINFVQQDENPVVSDSPAQTRAKMFTNTGGVNFRTGPGTRFKRIGSLRAGTHIDVEIEVDGWLMFRTQNGTEAYIHSDYVSRTNP